MNLSKRLFCILMILILILSLGACSEEDAPLADSIEEIYNGITLTYQREDATLTISGEGAVEGILDEQTKNSINISGEKREPSPYYLLRSLVGHEVKKVIVEEGITSIKQCFNRLAGMSEISLPESLKTIDSSFLACESLQKITIPKQVETIRASFRWCKALVEPKLLCAATIEENSFSNCPLLKEIDIPDHSILCNSFHFCEKLETIRLGAEVSCHDTNQKGCDESFGGSTPTNSSFYIKEPLHTEKATALSAGIPQLSSNLSGGKITLLAEDGEKEKDQLLPGSNTATFDAESGTLTLSGEGKVYNLYPRTLLSCSDRGYETALIQEENQIKRIVIEEGITALENCFNDLRALEEIVFPKSLTSVQLSFMGCTALQELTIPADCKEVSTHSFNECSNLHSLQFEGAVKIAPWGGFHRLDALEKVTIPENSELCSAFNYCSNLKAVTLQGNVKFHRAENRFLQEGEKSCFQSFEEPHKDCVYYLSRTLYEQIKPEHKDSLSFSYYIHWLDLYRCEITD